MTADANRAFLRRLSVVAVAAVVLGTSAVSAVMALRPGLHGNRAAAVASPRPPETSGSSPVRPALTALAQPVGSGRSTAKCAECGIVESIREVGQFAAEADMRGVAATPQKMPVKSYQLTIRMSDGTARVLTRASPWDRRPGAHVVLIEANGDATE
jgi:hypothetical protein